jgi:hypothetical protein
MNWDGKCEVYHAVEKMVSRYCNDSWMGLEKAFFVGDSGNPAKLAKEVVNLISQLQEGKGRQNGLLMKGPMNSLAMEENKEMVSNTKEKSWQKKY